MSVLESLHFVPEAGWGQAAFSILRAGKMAAAPDYRVVRDRHVGQDVLFCVSGTGFVETMGQKIAVRAGELAWIANEQPHAHHADPDDPWTLLWFRFDGPNMPLLRSKMFGEAVSLAKIEDELPLRNWFERLFAAMHTGGSGLEFRLNHLVGEFLSILDGAIRGDRHGALPEPLRLALSAMRGDIRKSWDSDALSALTHLSPSHLRRLFRKHLRTSPHQWLLRERLTRAQGLITDSDVAVAEVAELCGFCDVYHFSREFKRSIGTPPATWRRREAGHG